MGAKTSRSHGRRDACRTPARNIGAPRPLREDARRTSLVGLVRALPECASERQQSGGSRRRRSSLYGEARKCCSPLIWSSSRAANAIHARDYPKAEKAHGGNCLKIKDAG